MPGEVDDRRGSHRRRRHPNRKEGETTGRRLGGGVRPDSNQQPLDSSSSIDKPGTSSLSDASATHCRSAHSGDMHGRPGCCGLSVSSNPNGLAGDLSIPAAVNTVLGFLGCAAWRAAYTQSGSWGDTSGPPGKIYRRDGLPGGELTTHGTGTARARLMATGRQDLRTKVLCS